MIEPALAEAPPGEPVQFERQGYFCLDPDTTPERPVFNRTVRAPRQLGQDQQGRLRRRRFNLLPRLDAVGGNDIWHRLRHMSRSSPREP